MSVLDHILDIAKTDPVEAAIMLVQSTSSHDPLDPLRMPWSVRASLIAAQRFIPLTPEQLELVRAVVTDDPNLKQEDFS